MAPRPFFSICIPNYNYEKFIGETIESVLDQSFEDFEIIVADNASTDGSVKVIESLRTPKLRLLQNRYNIGFSPNLDRATAGARGEHLLLLSSDDLMLPRALETYAEVLRSLGERRHEAVLTSAFDIIDPRRQILEIIHRPKGSLFYRAARPEDAHTVDVERPPELFSGLEALGPSLRARESPAAFVATCYSRRLYDAVEGYRNGSRISPDSHFLWKLLAQDPVFVYVPQRLFAYRMHNSNQASTEAAQGALKYQVDGYLQTLEFPESALVNSGVGRQEMIEVYIERAVIERGLRGLAAGNVWKAFRCLAWGMATYPRETLREPKTYGLAALLALGPAGTVAAKSLFRAHQVIVRHTAGRHTAARG